eukprot:1156235-Pelagomonas_calceolata.AAC.15
MAHQQREPSHPATRHHLAHGPCNSRLIAAPLWAPPASWSMCHMTHHAPHWATLSHRTSALSYKLTQTNGPCAT